MLAPSKYVNADVYIQCFTCDMLNHTSSKDRNQCRFNIEMGYAID